MSYTVTISIRQNRDYSNSTKDKIIGALPGPYKVSHAALDDLDKGGSHVFEFKNEEPAANFANQVFSNWNTTFDVITSFQLNK